MINHQNGFSLYNQGKGQTTVTTFRTAHFMRKKNIITTISNITIENADWNIL